VAAARPVNLIITMIKWIRTSRLSIKNSLCTVAAAPITLSRSSSSAVCHYRGTSHIRKHYRGTSHIRKHYRGTSHLVCCLAWREREREREREKERERERERESERERGGEGGYSSTRSTTYLRDLQKACAYVGTYRRPVHMSLGPLYERCGTLCSSN